MFLFVVLLSLFVDSNEASLERLHGLIRQTFVGEIFAIQNAARFTDLNESRHCEASWNISEL